MNKNIFKILSIVLVLSTIISCEEDNSINIKPVAAFSIEETSIEVGTTLVFTDLSFDQDGSIVSWNWNFGDDSTSTEQSPEHTFDVEGEFEIELSVTDNSGQVNANEFTKTIDVVEPSTATINPTLKWKYSVPYKTNQSNMAVSDDGVVYFGTDGKSSDLTRGDYNMFAVKDGNLLWGHISDEVVRSSPSIGTDGSVYFGDYNGVFFGFNADGSSLWSVTYSRFKYASPAIDADGTIYVGGEDKEFRAINPADGSLIWAFETTNAIRTSSAIDSEGNIYFTDNAILYALSADGTEKWRQEYGVYTACGIAMDESAKTIYVSDRDLHLFAISMEDGSVKWNNSTAATDNTELGGPAVGPDGTIYLGGEDSKMVAYNAEDGSVKWEFETNGKIKAVPAIDNDGNLYFGDEAGYFYVVSPEGETKWKETVLDGSVSTSAVIDDNGVIYVLSSNSDNTGTLYAFETYATGPANEGWPMRSKNSENSGQ